MRVWIVLGALNGFLAVVAGAIGAHGVAGHLVGAVPNVFERAATYHLVHALALICAALWASHADAHAGLAKAACALFLLGMILFCGSLYLRGLTGFHPIVLLTPFGGGALMVGWLALAASAWPSRRSAP
jgi:uncharacterized membrane protein YgdD (TMEM256/DUF423 family)